MYFSKGIFLIALAGFAEVALSHKPGKGPNRNAKRNFIMVIPDGFGPASEALARHYTHWTNNATIDLPIDKMQIGGIRTRSTDSYVPDSASTATAYSCGIKTYNGGIAVDDSYAPCGTVLEAAKAKGYKTGLIVTSRITHATPATYASHIYDRDIEDNIARQLIGENHPLGKPQVDLILGGGRCYFTPKSTAKSCRKDDIDLLGWAKSKAGYQVLTTRKDFEKKTKLPYIGLFTESHMSYEIDRDPAVEPSLTEMAIKGLNDLLAASKKEKTGFFVMIEASRIDHAGHANDPVGHLHDILQYNTMMKTVTEWIDKNSDAPTTLISTADHECGGLTLGYSLTGPPDYWWAPQYFAGAKNTYEVLAAKWKSYAGTDAAYLKTEIFGKYGVPDPTAAELAAATAGKSSTSAVGAVLAKAMNARLGVNWSTGGHTGVDVNLYGYGVNHLKMVGNHENSDVGNFVAQELGLDLKSITRKLQKNKKFIDAYVKPQGKVQKRDSCSKHVNEHL
ncbi:alkaline phosphatase-like protein [Ascobolus immersus RN42]|uniref:Alkaline phosphatase n=1 Tax=Ascobolus immersus RN42 TaxID=1160509 RepID=A0A3N4I5K9_ASCIM|nr:alkaline phosphatase-like protein [Ascobolus immersus RN42]